MDKEELKSVYEALKEIKSQYDGLLGSKEVWNFLREERESFRSPFLIVDSINSRLNRNFLQITYTATPERADGLFASVVCMEEKKELAELSSQVIPVTPGSVAA